MYWGRYQAELTPRVIEALRNMEVPYQNGWKISLEYTFYLSKEMLQLCSNATLEGIFNKFIDVPVNLATDNVDGWQFLASFSVTLKADSDFF